MQEAGVDQPIETVLADGGYWNNPQIVALGDQGVQVIVPTRSAVRTKPRKLALKHIAGLLCGLVRADPLATVETKWPSSAGLVLA